MMDRFLRRMGIICILAGIAAFSLPVTAQSAGSLMAMGDALVDQGKYEEAIGYYNQSVALDPKMAMAWCGKGIALNGLGRYAEANDAFDKAIAISPSYSKAWYQKGNALYGLGRYEEAIAAYDKALEIYPEYGYLAYYGKANALSGLGRYSEAIPLYDKALSLEPGHAGAWVKKGDAQAATGDYQGAIAAYDKALSIEPNSTLAKTAREAAAANLSGAAAVTTPSPGQTRTTVPITTTGQPTVSPPATTKKGIPLPLWLCGTGIIVAAFLAAKRK